MQIGSDQGLLAAPVEHTALTIVPGERFDVVVDFSGFPPGTEITMVNTLGESPQTRAVMRFRVTSRVRDDSRVPPRLAELPPADRAAAVTVRTFDFRRTRHDSGDMWTINGEPYSRAGRSREPRLGTTEVWRFTSDFHHPVHLHLGALPGARPGHPRAGGDRRGPEGHRGRPAVRDRRRAGAVRRLPGRYMFHCHNLEHEDMAMMADFRIV